MAFIFKENCMAKSLRIFSSFMTVGPDIHIAVSVVYDTFEKLFFEHSCSNCFILHFNCEMKLGVLLI